MIGAENFGTDIRLSKTRNERLGDEDVVDAPPHVPCAGPAEVAPPRVRCRGIRMEMPIGINESEIEEPIESRALLGSKSLFTDIRLRICEVDLFVCHVQIPTKHDRLGLFEGFYEFGESAIPLLPDREAREIILRIRGVDRNNIEIIVFERDRPPLSIELVIDS